MTPAQAIANTKLMHALTAAIENDCVVAVAVAHPNEAHEQDTQRFEVISNTDDCDVIEALFYNGHTTVHLLHCEPCKAAATGELDPNSEGYAKA